MFDPELFLGIRFESEILVGVCLIHYAIRKCIFNVLRLSVILCPMCSVCLINHVFLNLHLMWPICLTCHVLFMPGSPRSPGFMSNRVCLCLTYYIPLNLHLTSPVYVISVCSSYV